MKKVKVTVYWPDDHKSVILTQAEWQSILDGSSLSKSGEGYLYEGEEFEDFWTFDGGSSSNVCVTYGEGSVGFEGTLDECEIEEIQ